MEDIRDTFFGKCPFCDVEIIGNYEETGFGLVCMKTKSLCRGFVEMQAKDKHTPFPHTSCEIYLQYCSELGAD